MNPNNIKYSHKNYCGEIKMDNKNDWEKLEEWNASKEENNIFYENEDIKSQAKKFSKITSIFSVVTAMPLVVIFFILLIFTLLFLVAFFNSLKVDTETDILEQLKNQYSQDFVIIDEKNINKNEIEYKISPKNNKNIVFKAIQKNFTQYNDYEDYLIKQILLEYMSNFPGTNLKYKDDTNISNNYEFYKLRYGIEIKNYSEISQAVKEIYECNDYISKRINKIIKKNNVYFNGYLKLDNWSTEVQNNIYNISLDEYIYNIKYLYIDYLQSNDIEDKNITNEEIYSIWKPKELNIYLNNNYIEKETATYNLELKEYEINFNIILNNVDGIEKKYDKYGKLKGFIYNGKEYDVHYNNNKLENNSIPFQCRISILENFFKFNVKYNYTSKLIYLSI